MRSNQVRFSSTWNSADDSGCPARLTGGCEAGLSPGAGAVGHWKVAGMGMRGLFCAPAACSRAVLRTPVRG